ncbi:unnamed protein product [Acanthosepion pharaonis]|uniref:Uncharacterized protein n=1 Tax=Acanthosepion pharaonis TaxID=158019 RepID=A0A812D8G8_ACAPH|nr:unnamed protein product [Sepia pharaonis]
MRRDQSALFIDQADRRAERAGDQRDQEGEDRVRPELHDIAHAVGGQGCREDDGVPIGRTGPSPRPPDWPEARREIVGTEGRVRARSARRACRRRGREPCPSDQFDGHATDAEDLAHRMDRIAAQLGDGRVELIGGTFTATSQVDIDEALDDLRLGGGEDGAAIECGQLRHAVDLVSGNRVERREARATSSVRQSFRSRPTRMIAMTSAWRTRASVIAFASTRSAGIDRRGRRHDGAGSPQNGGDKVAVMRRRRWRRPPARIRRWSGVIPIAKSARQPAAGGRAVIAGKPMLAGSSRQASASARRQRPPMLPATANRGDEDQGGPKPPPPRAAPPAPGASGSATRAVARSISGGRARDAATAEKAVAGGRGHRLARSGPW